MTLQSRGQVERDRGEVIIPGYTTTTTTVTTVSTMASSPPDGGFIVRHKKLASAQNYCSAL